MLRPPFTRYDRLYVYYFDRRDLPLITDPDYIGTWIEDDKAILFFHRAKDALIQTVCRSTGAEIIYQADLDYRDWEAGTVIGPFNTKTLSVCPVWELGGSDNDAYKLIILDPSVIFGSGFHATTRLCLETLELVLLESGERIESVLDLGTGTGLLAIAAAKLGVKQVTAVDNNPMACEVAEKNVRLNGCTPQIRVEQIDLMTELPDLEKYDLVIANLYKGLLLNLFANARFWQAKMHLISGFIAGMEAELLAALPSKGIRVLHRGNREMWRLWLLKNMPKE
ncbi:MAG: 50S ribosomal protein L11 methyltransferase [Desulfobulbaceae bacterium]|nr:50S ribosomal protein L11 methyltransferase [Desulfobulbaceae bacterium]